MAVAVLAIPFVSCSKKQVSTIPAESGEPEVELVEMTFDSEKEDIDATKLVIGGLTTNDAHVYWNPGDAISVFDGVGNQEFTRQESETSRVATFKGTAAAGKSAYYSLSPYYADASMESAGVISCRIPTQQTANIAYEGGDVSMDATALLAIAKSSEAPAVQVLKFQNLYSLIVFEVGSDYAGKITSVTVEGNNLENIAGDFKVTVKDDALEYENGTNPASWVTLKPNGGSGTFAAGKYAIAVRPCVLENGYRLIVRKDGTKKSSIVTKTGSGKAFVRNSGLNTGTAAVSAAMAATDNFKYYAIHTKAELDEWNKDGVNWVSTDKVYLGADIDYGKDVYWRGVSGAVMSVFSGTFDGRNHRIYNIEFRGQEKRAGFVYANTGIIKNVCFGSSDYDFEQNKGTADGWSKVNMDGANASAASWYYVGLIPYLGAGTAAESKGTISNVVNFCDVLVNIPENTSLAHYFRAGGIAGSMKANTSIIDCKNFGNVTHAAKKCGADELNNSVAGIVSTNDGNNCTITGCSNYGAVTSQCSKTFAVAGIIACVSTYSNLTLHSCSNFGAIRCEEAISGNALFMGGIAGRIRKAFTTDKNKGFVNTGSVTFAGASTSGDCQLGGFSGGDLVTDVTCTNSGKISFETSAENKITIGANLYMGGIAGYIKCNLSNCTNEQNGQVRANMITVKGQIFAGGIVGGIGDGTFTLSNLTNKAYVGFGTDGDANAIGYDSDKKALYSYIGGICGGGNTNTDTAPAGVQYTYKDCRNTNGVYYKGYHRARQGGIAGYSNKCPSMTNASDYVINSGNVSYFSLQATNQSDVGGIVGCMPGVTAISKLRMNANVNTQGSSPRAYTGGIVGNIKTTAATFTDCIFGDAAGDQVKGVGANGNTVALFTNVEANVAVTFENCKIKNGVKHGDTSISAWDNSIVCKGVKPGTTTAVTPTVTCTGCGVF